MGSSVPQAVVSPGVVISPRQQCPLGHGVHQAMLSPGVMASPGQWCPLGNGVPWVMAFPGPWCPLEWWCTLHHDDVPWTMVSPGQWCPLCHGAVPWAMVLPGPWCPLGNGVPWTLVFPGQWWCPPGHVVAWGDKAPGQVCGRADAVLGCVGIPLLPPRAPCPPSPGCSPPVAGTAPASLFTSCTEGFGFGPDFDLVLVASSPGGLRAKILFGSTWIPQLWHAPSEVENIHDPSKLPRNLGVLWE